MKGDQVSHIKISKLGMTQHLNSINFEMQRSKETELILSHSHALNI